MDLLKLLAFAATASCAQQFCKCQCLDHSITKKIAECSSCTKEWCVQQNRNICLTEEVADSIVISCFQNESTKEYLIVLFFSLAVIGLLGNQVYLRLWTHNTPLH